MHVALSYREFNKLREKKYISAKQKGFQLASFVSEQSNLSKNIRIGENCFMQLSSRLNQSGEKPKKKDIKLKRNTKSLSPSLYKLHFARTKKNHV